MDAMNTETFAETAARYIAKYGAVTLRAMAADWRMYSGGLIMTARRMPLRYAVAAEIVAKGMV